MYLVVSLIFVASLNQVLANSHDGTRRKVLNHHHPQMLTFFRGTIEENADFVELSSPIFALDKDAPSIAGKICEYKIYSELTPIPFEISVLNKTTGEAELTLSEFASDLNCQVKSRYNFTITAVDCGTGNLQNQLESLRSMVIIDVIDVNDNEPVFEKSRYSVSFNENNVDYDKIMQVRAIDDDCTSQHNTICKYSIKSDKSGLFKVDKNGVISMQRDTSVQTADVNHSFKVVAYDCGGLKSLPTRVSVLVLANCSPGWSDITKRVEYTSLTGNKTQVLYPSASLSTCLEDDTIESLTLTIDLDTSYIGKGCDRDTRSSTTMATMCGENKHTVFDFLPTTEDYNEMLEHEDEKFGFILPIFNFVLVTTDNSRRKQLQANGQLAVVLVTITFGMTKKRNASEAEKIFKFDGNSEIFNVGGVHSDIDGALRNGVFSLSMWLRTSSDVHKKDNFTILSKSNSKGIHEDFILYLKNCRLNLVTRTNGAIRRWNWKLSLNEVCDELWHHYVIKVTLDDASLLIDGTISYDASAEMTRYQQTTSSKPKQAWVVGALWKLRGGKNHFSYNYKGLMAGLTIYSGMVDDNLAKCATECQEGLYLPKDYNNEMATIEMSKFTLKVTMTKGDFESAALDVLSHLSYFNERTFPTSIERQLIMKTSVICKSGQAKCHEIEDVQSYIVVLHTPKPTYTISGVNHIARPANALQEGINMFNDIKIWAAIEDSSLLNSVDGSPIYQIDECRVSVENEDITAEEMLFVRPQTVLTDNNLSLARNKNGITISGPLNLSGYELVLRSVVYQHSLPRDLNEKLFSVKCSELNGRFETNKIAVTLTVLHPSKVLKRLHISGIQSVHGEAAIQHFQTEPEMLQLSLSNSIAWQKSGTPQHAKLKNEDGENDSVILPVLIVGVCLGLLALLVAAMMIQSHLFRREEEQMPILDDTYGEDDGKEEINVPGEMDWDDSALTITVNPLQSKGFATDCSENEFSDLEYEDLNETRQMCKSKKTAGRS